MRSATASPARRRFPHPDLLPSAEDLDEPAAFIDRMIGGDTSGIDDAIDQAIADLQKDSDKGDDTKE
jgi:hypothetical protein